MTTILPRMSVLTVQSIFLMFAAALVLTASASAQVPGGQQRQRLGPTGSAVPPGARNRLQPDWIPLAPKHEAYLDQVLSYWEARSKKVKRYRCKFERWEFDPVFGPKNTFSKYSTGLIKYAAPDKGMFKVETIQSYQAPREPGGQPTYAELPNVHGEHWICDGKAIFEHDHQNQRLIERQLPAQLQGKAIADGPLPFLFGAEKDKIKSRYWIRVITPEDAKGEYWLEAHPKSQGDAASYKKVHVVIDEQDFLPKMLMIFASNFDPQRNPAYTTFAFKERDVNWSILAQQLNVFHREFFEPATPNGWKKVVQPFQSGGAAQVPPAASGARTSEARRTGIQRFSR